MPKIADKHKQDLIALINEKIDGFQGLHTGMGNAEVEERRQALLSIVHPSAEYQVTEKLKDAVKDLGELLTPEGAKLYDVKEDQFEAFKSLAFATIYQRISVLSNLEGGEAKAIDEERAQSQAQQTANRSRVSQARSENESRYSGAPLSHRVLIARQITAACLFLLGGGLAISGTYGTVRLFMLAATAEDDDYTQDNNDSLNLDSLIAVLAMAATAVLTFFSCKMGNSIAFSSSSFSQYNTFLSRLFDRRSSNNQEHDESLELLPNRQTNYGAAEDDYTEGFHRLFDATATQNNSYSNEDDEQISVVIGTTPSPNS